MTDKKHWVATDTAFTLKAIDKEFVKKMAAEGAAIVQTALEQSAGKWIMAPVSSDSLTSTRAKTTNVILGTDQSFNILYLDSTSGELVPKVDIFLSKAGAVNRLQGIFNAESTNISGRNAIVANDTGKAQIEEFLKNNIVRTPTAFAQSR